MRRWVKQALVIRCCVQHFCRILGTKWSLTFQYLKSGLVPNICLWCLLEESCHKWTEKQRQVMMHLTFCKSKMLKMLNKKNIKFVCSGCSICDKTVISLIKMSTSTNMRRGRCCRDRMVVVLPMQSVPITTDVNWNLNQSEMYKFMWLSLSVTCNRSVVFSGCSGVLNQ